MNIQEIEEKIEFLLNNAVAIKKIMFVRENNKLNIIYLIQNILLSNKRLIDCDEYNLISNYIEKEKEVDIEIKKYLLNEILSVLISFNSKISSQRSLNDINTILEYKKYIKKIA